MTGDEYRRAFGLSETPKSDPDKALQLALDIRKFEIDLYWKRAAYFWAFLAVTLAGYLSLLLAQYSSRPEKGEALLTVLCLGVVFSVAWYFVNRASKFWQENWERHVDLLEDNVVGPLYKTVLSDTDLHFANLSGPYRFSVSKINQLLSLFVVVLFLVLLAATLFRYYRFGWPPDLFATTLLILTTLAVLVLYWKGQTKLGDSVVRATRRRTEVG